MNGRDHAGVHFTEVLTALYELCLVHVEVHDMPPRLQWHHVGDPHLIWVSLLLDIKLHTSWHGHVICIEREDQAPSAPRCNCGCVLNIRRNSMANHQHTWRNLEAMKRVISLHDIEFDSPWNLFDETNEAEHERPILHRILNG